MASMAAVVNQFVHLHLHTQYSLLDGANKIPDVIERAKSIGQSALAITDHGNMHGAIEFYSAAQGLGIKPIIGCELYVTSGSRFEKKMRAQGGEGTYHLTVLASNMVGYRNLCRLATLAYREGFYFKPRVDHELLERYNEGLIALSGCLGGELAEFVQRDNIESARKLIEYYAGVFKDRFYLEVQPHMIKEQQKLNQGCEELYKSLGVPIVATTDCHYPTKDDHFAQEVLMCVSTGKQVTDPDRLRHEGVDLHLKSADEMYQEFGSWGLADEAIKNTVAIAEKCSIKFDFKTYYMPQAKSEDSRPLTEVMAEKARVGLESKIEQFRKHLPNWSDEDAKLYRERLEGELKLIEKMGFAGYFLVVSDFIVWAKEHGVPVGPGRGSAAGSLVAYAMRITEVDPIKNKLLFERFLNPERVSLPDIDVDFCINGRDRVIQYVVGKYGKENVAQIGTFGTLKAKAAIKDVGRALGMSFAETDRVAQLVPAPRQGFDYPIAEAIKMEPKLAEYAKGEGKQLIELAMKLEGLTRHTSTHAAGVVIGDRPLIEHLPLMVDKDGNDVTQFSMKYVEKVGLVKFDFLGLRTLTMLHTALRFIKASRGEELDLEFLPFEDKATYTMLCGGNTIGVFQLESSGITEMTMRLKPSCFDDLVAILALYRPGPLDAGMVDHYVERKHGRAPVVYLHALMENALKDTYGIILYQEQIMQLARELAGFSLGEADLLRRAMGKKNPEEMAAQRDRFLRGAIEHKIPDKLANEIFDQMETFARYGFNRSHSAAYAMISFQTAYLKTHYSVEFMAALMSSEMDDTDKVLKNLNECRKNKIAVLPPTVNEGGADFSVCANKIRYGLQAVKGIGEKAVQAIVEERGKKGAYKDLEDFLIRVDLHAVNKKVVENLVKCGAFDFAGESRAGMFARIEEQMHLAQGMQAQKDTNQMSLFGGSSASPTLPKRSAQVAEWPTNQRLALEREALGTYLSGHPLEKFRNDVKRLGAITVAELKESDPPRRSSNANGRFKSKAADTRMAGVVTALKLKNTKKGDRYATFTFEDFSGTIEAIVWPDVYKKVAALLVVDEPMLIIGSPDITEDRAMLIVDKMDSLIAIRDKSAKQGVLMLREADNIEKHLDRLLAVLRKHNGPCPVKVKLLIDNAEVSLTLRDREQVPVAVIPSESLCDEVEQLFGRPVLAFT